MRRGWLLAVAIAGFAVAALLAWAWNDAGVVPVRPLTAPAVVPQVDQ
ncbi:MAG: hypothetical protein JSR96_15755 [Proteobacteria bacterium]|nr:hypothetical protein [Pseudomonadota bacterium]